jgi:glycosyltransferase involved in cell wall biosynthesis
MIRVLQLIDTSASFQNARTATHLASQLGPGFSVERRILDGTSQIIKTFRQQRRVVHDIIHAFTPRSLAVASAIGGKIVYTAGETPSQKMAGWVRAAAAYRDLNLVCATDSLRRFYVERGLPIARCHLIRPGVEFSRIARRRNDILRATLGFRPTDHVMLCAGSSTRAANHRLAIWAASILHVLDPRHRLLLWGRGETAESNIDFAASLKRHDFFTAAIQRLARQVEFEELLPAADTILITPVAPSSTLAIAICMAAGLPIVATVTPTVAELLEDRHTALLTTAQPRAVAQRVLDLLADNNLQWSISDMARTEAYDYFSLTRFLEQHRALYRQLAAGQTIQLPQPQPGAGARFHGRAS